MANNNQISIITGNIYGGQTAGHVNISGDPDSRRQRITSWLCPLEFFQKQKTIFSNYHPGTLHWFLRSEKFKRWLDGRTEVLWCHGAPGAGKTVLASFLVNHLRKVFKGDEKVGVAAVFCEWKSQDLLTPEHLLASIWTQLISNKPYSQEVETVYYRHARLRTKATIDEIYWLLEQEMQACESVYIIVDALDELGDEREHRSIFLRNLRSLATSLRSKVHLMITSRSKDCPFTDSTNMQVFANSNDIIRYVDHVILHGLSSSPEASDWVRNDAATRKLLKDSISNKASGLFLLARLYLQSLRSKINRHDLLTAIDSLPASIEELYDETWDRIIKQNEDHKRLAERILGLISHVVRPLAVAELRHALAVRQGETNMDKNRLVFEDLLVQCCLGLVSIDSGSKIIRLVHHTAQQWLDSHRSRLFPNAHAEILHICLTYLSYDEFKLGPCEFRDFTARSFNSSANGKRINKKRFLPTRLAAFPFLHYAASNWGRHAVGEIQRSCQQEILAFLGENMLLQSAAQVQDDSLIYAWPRNRENLDNVIRNLPLYVATSFGLEHITTALLNKLNGIELNQTYGSAKITPLHRAVELGNETMVSMLLAAGADTRPHDQSRHSVLYKAIARGHDAITEVLLKHEEGVINDSRVIYWAVFSGGKAVVQSLLAHLHDEAKRVQRLHAIFHEATRLGKISTMNQAFELGADIERKDDSGRTALFTAVAYGRYDAAELLLKRNASMNVRDLKGRSLLQIATSSLNTLKERLKCIRSFRQEWTEDPGFPDRFEPFEDCIAPERWFLKQLATWLVDVPRAEELYRDSRFREDFYDDSEYPRIIQLLLDHGADISERTPSGESMLHLAVCSVGRARVILKNRGDKLIVDELDHNGRTPFHYAAAAGFPKVMKLLQQFGARSDIRDNYHTTALHFGVNWPACTAFTIKQGPEVNAQDCFRRTALHYATLVEEPVQKVTTLLVEAGVKPGTVDLRCKTAEQYMSDHYAEEKLGEALKWIENMSLGKYQHLRIERLRSAMDNSSYYASRYSQHFHKRLSESGEAAKTWTVVSDSEDEDYEPEGPPEV